MKHPAEHRPFYWVLFTVDDAPEAQLFAGRLIITNGEPWLNLREQDIPQIHPRVALQTKLDEAHLLECSGDDLGIYYFYRGVVPLQS